jgi:hypothetical protein
MKRRLGKERISAFAGFARDKHLMIAEVLLREIDKTGFQGVEKGYAHQ